MTLYVSPSLVISPADAFPANYPLICWDSVVTFSGLAATSSAVGYPVTNLSTVSTIDRWVGGSAAELVVSLTGIDAEIDYVGIARHNLGSAGIEVSVETLAGDVGAAWEEVFAPVLPGDDAPLVLRFALAPVIGVRLRLAAGDAAPQMAVLRVGKALRMQRGLQSDFVPFHRAVSTDKLDGANAAGDYLGTIITRQQIGSTASFKALTNAWYTANMEAFVLAANAGDPFFFIAEPEAHPDQVGYCRINGSATPRYSLSMTDYLDISLPLRAIVS